MKIPAAKIELATSPEASRYMLQAVNLNVEAKQFAATDGHTSGNQPQENNLMTTEEFDAFVDDATHSMAKRWERRAEVTLSADLKCELNDVLTAFFGKLRTERSFE